MRQVVMQDEDIVEYRKILELNYTLPLDWHLVKLLEPTNQFYTVPSDVPGEVSGNATLLSPANSIMIEYLKDKTDKPEADKILKELIS